MRKSSWIGRLCTAAAGLLCAGASALGAPGDVVISQVWGGPSGTGGSVSYPRADYVELFNRTNAPVSMSGWSLNIATTSGTSWTKLDLTASIPARSYFLVRVSADATNGASIPAHDAQFGTLSFTTLSTTGKVCLRDTTEAIGANNCPVSNIIDLVTYGSSGTCFEGSGRAPAGSTTAPGSATFRRGDGCVDTDDNTADFVLRPAAARNSSISALATCDIGACCDNAGTGSCVLETDAGCTALGFTFVGVATTCSPTTCSVTGACCTGTNTTTCNVRTQAGCAGRWTLGAACSPDSACSAATSCCLPDGSCCPMVAVLCVDAGGTPGPYALGCSAVGSCVPPVVNDLCINALPLTLGVPRTGNGWSATFTDDGPAVPCLNGSSASSRGIWFTFVPPATGIYEFDSTGTQFDSDMVVYTIPNCSTPSSWTVVGCDDQSVGNPALPAFCGNSTGAVVSARLRGVPLQGGATYHVRITLNGTLSNSSGNYRLVANSQATEATGACCFATNGRCEIRTQAGCLSAEAPLGTYLGDGVACSPSPCAPAAYGACCTTTSCQIRIESACTGGTAFWLEGAVCDPVPCEISPLPPNGTCATAQVISDAQLPFGAIVGINQAPDGPPISCNTALVTRNAVWYAYTPATNGVVSAWETGTRDVSVVAYDAGVGSATCDAWIEVFCDGAEADANFSVLAGHTYYILFTTPGSASTGATDFYNIQIRHVVPTTPSNISCETALPLTSSASMQSFPAGGAPVGPRSQCQTLANQLEARSAIWFSYTTGTNDELIRVQRFNNQTFFSLQFYTEGCALLPYQCQDLGTANNFIRLRKNTNYRIMAHKKSGYMAGDANYQFIFESVAGVAQTPNADCATATVVNTLPYTDTANAILAFDEPAISNCGGVSGAANFHSGVWYQFSPAAPMIVDVLETGTLDATIAVFENGCGGNRILCSTSDNDSTGYSRFRALPGITYSILVGYDSTSLPAQTAIYNISIEGTAGIVPPNDTCATATPIPTLPFSETTANGLASDETPRAVCSRGTLSNVTRNGIWYTYTNGAQPAAAVFAESSPQDALVAVYKGGCGNLEPVMCTEAPESNAYLYMQPNTTYHILVAKAFDVISGPADVLTFTMDVAPSVIPPPANTTCSTAEQISDFPFTYTAVPLASPHLPVTSCAYTTGLTVSQSTNPIWFTFESGTGFTLKMYETSSGSEVNYALYTNCGFLLESFCSNSDGSVTTPISFTLDSNTRYYLQVARDSNNDYAYGAAPLNLTITAADGTNGACCNGSTCTTTVIENCSTGFIPGGACLPTDPCASASQFCCRGTTCNTVASGTCTGSVAGGNSLVVSSCGAGTALASCCYADFNHDGNPSIDDLFIYLNAYFAVSPYANMGGDGIAAPNIDDLFLYINAYFAGCQ